MNDIKKILGLAFVFFIVANISAQDWDQVNGIDTNRVFKELVFLDINNGVAIDDQSRMWLTITSSNNWEENSYTGGQTLHGIESINSSQFWLTGSNGTIALGTVQGASINYITLPTPTSNTLKNCHFIDQNNGWFVGENGTLIRTENSGSSFQLQPIPGFTNDFNDVAISDNIGVIVTSDNRVGISRDGGKTWGIGNTLPTTNNLKIIFENNAFYVLSANSTILRSFDGDTWTTIPAPSSEINEMEFRNGSLYIVANSGESYVSNNLGSQWVELNGIPNDINLTTISCVENGCFTGGTRGKIYWNCQEITVGGKVWGDKSTDCSLQLNDENGYSGVEVSLLTNGGAIVSSTTTDENGDYSFTIPEGTYNIRLNAINFEVGKPLFAAHPCGSAIDPNNNVTGDQNGFLNNGVVELSNNIVLRCGEELGPLGVVNYTVDFGLTFDCNINAHPEAALSCVNPNFICDLSSIDNGCYTMNDNLVMSGGYGCLQNEPTANLTWFTFYGGIGNYQIEVIKNGCFPGETGDAGFKIGVIQDCDDNPEIYCEDFCNSGEGAFISSSLFVPGQLYNIWIDGCEGSVCGYTIEVTGNYSPYIAPVPNGLLCGDASCSSICLGSNVSIQVDDISNSYGSIDVNFNWEILNSGGGLVFSTQTDTNVLEYEFSTVGSYDLCLKSIENFCGEQSINYCETVNVIEIFDEDFGEVELCTNELSLYNGPQFVNDDPSNTSDPNNDGVMGWQGPMQFMPGFNSVIVNSPAGCEYEQFVNIVVKPDSEIAELEFIVCGDDEFPIFVLDQNYFQQVKDQFINVPGGAVNGCDSLNSLTIIHIEIDGAIQQMGCDNENVLLEFVPTINMNTFAFPTNSEWTDENGNLIPDDGDGNPFTINVPFGSEVYSFSIDVDVNGVRSCEYSFTYELNFDLPTISAVDSICVNDEAEFLFNLPQGINSTPLWNVDDGEFEGNFLLDEIMNISWPTEGTKTITLAYLEDGCYVEQIKTIEVLPKYIATDISCASGDNSVVFSWPALDFNQIVDVDVISGQIGVLNGNTFTISDLHGGESVTVAFDIESDICEDYSIISICSANPCSDIVNLPNFYSCDSANTNTICDISSLNQGCSTLDLTTTENIGVPCIVGVTYNTKWIPFVAGVGDYEINIQVFNCDQQSTNDGVQYGLFKECDIDNPVICSDNCSSNDILISSEGLEPGQKYVIMLNGCNGTFCDFSIEVTGDFNEIEVPSINDILLNGVSNDTILVCENEIVMVDLDVNPDSIINSAEYKWHLKDMNGNVIETIVYNDKSFQFNTDSMGFYELCLTEVSHPCNTVLLNDFCVVINVQKEYDQIEIFCDQSTNEIVFSWSPLPGHLSYDVEVLTGQTGVLVDTTFTVNGLSQDEIVTIVLNTQTADGCNELITEQTCVASICPQVNVIIDFGGPFQICLNDSVDIINFTPNITPMVSGVGYFTGNGIIDSIEGLYDPRIPGAGNHIISYVFIAEDSCVYSTSSDVIIEEETNASFEFDNESNCTDENARITFTGIANSSSIITWNFGDLIVINGNDLGPFDIAANNPGDYIVTLNLTSDICPEQSYSDTISFVNCSDCICENIIDTTIACTTIFDPVCGCDGVTYNNACEAQFYAGVRSWFNGPCSQTLVDTIAAFCDDENPLTINDAINEDCQCEGEIIDATDDAENNIGFYPNPTTGRIYFDGLDGEEVKGYSLLGNLIFTKTIKDKQIDISIFSTGFYVIKVGDKGVIRVYKE